MTGSSNLSDYIIVGCVALWAIRLGYFLFFRIQSAVRPKIQGN